MNGAMSKKSTTPSKLTSPSKGIRSVTLSEKALIGTKPEPPMSKEIRSVTPSATNVKLTNGTEPTALPCS